jgi:hypothetical protein
MIVAAAERVPGLNAGVKGPLATPGTLCSKEVIAVVVA